MRPGEAAGPVRFGDEEKARREAAREVATQIRRHGLEIRRAANHNQAEAPWLALQFALIAVRVLEAGSKLDQRLEDAYAAAVRYVARRTER